MVDFTPDLDIEDMKSILSQHKHKFAVIFDLMFCLLSFLHTL